MELRHYQQTAVDRIYDYLREKSGNPCVVLPTGSGKTPLLATLCRDAVVNWDGRVLVLAHVKELLEQSLSKIKAVAPDLDVGVYSAGLKRKEKDNAVVVAGIQSAYKRGAELGRFDLVIVDEAHLISEKSEGTYQQLLSDLMEINPDLRIIGLTATPYRTGDGDLCGKDKLLTEIAYEVGVKQLINEGFLSRIVNKHAVGSIDTSAIKIVRGEFDDRQAEAAFIEGAIVRNACEEILGWTATRKSVLIFCQTIDHARMVVNHLEIALANVESIFGDTPDNDRADILKRFKDGQIQYLVNVNVLTTGFDAPNVDAVVLLRATVSPGLYYQMVGRGFRLAEGKENCLLLDFGGNVRRHGPVDVIRPKAKGKSEEQSNRVCPSCREVLPVACKVCTECDFVFEKQEREITHDPFADDAEPVSTDPVTERVPVEKVFYNVHTKKGADEGTPQTLRVTYQLSMFSRVSEWVCVEHEGFARKKAQKWWALRSHDECPQSAAQAVQMAEDGRVLSPISITIKTTPGKAFPEIVWHELPPLDTLDSPDAVGEFDALELEAMALMDTLNTKLTLVPAEEEDCPF